MVTERTRSLFTRRRSTRLTTCGPGEMVALVDNWFQTGSQALAAKSLFQGSGARYVGASIIVDQLSEPSRQRLRPATR